MQALKLLPEWRQIGTEEARGREKGRTLTVANATITDELESRLHIVHGDGLPHPAPVPDGLDSNGASIELEALRGELLLATFEPDSTAGKRDIGDASTAALLRAQTNLRRASGCYQFDVLEDLMFQQARRTFCIQYVPREGPVSEGPISSC